MAPHKAIVYFLPDNLFIILFSSRFNSRFNFKGREAEEKKEHKIEVGKKHPHETDMSSPTVSTQTSTVPEYPGFVKKGKNGMHLRIGWLF